ncbi:MAG: polysaccharide pyruvyl transferase family protein [Bradymonadaceae bacterium]|nr:polysaccharide pyruvyl transferase family protein [Lujinxingiaceae bacterium]
MKILITNTVVLNGGDAAILQSIMEVLRKEFGEDTRFVVFDSQPEVAQRYYPEIDFRKLLYYRAGWAPRVARNVLRPVNLRRFALAARLRQRGLEALARELLTDEELRDLKEYETADLIVSTGGTYLVENYDLMHRVFDFEIALITGRPLVFYTQSLGPFKNKANRRTLARIFNRASLVLLRDELSRRHLLEIGVAANKLHVSADAVFALADPHRKPRRASKPSAKRPLRVAISVRDWVHFVGTDREQGMANYREALVAATAYLVQTHGAEVTYVSTCQGIAEYWTHDSRVAHAIVDTLGPTTRSKVIVDEAFHTPEQLVELLSGFDLVIATRMHMAILALVAGTPVLPIAYEFKTAELFGRLGSGRWIQDINTIEADEFVELLAALLASLKDVRETQLEGVVDEHARAMDAARHVRAAIAH